MMLRTTKVLGRRSLSNVSGTFTATGIEERGRGTLKHQDKLPKLPVPTLEDTMDRYLERCLPLLDGESERQACREGVAKFLAGDGPAVHQRLLDYDKEKDNYLNDFYEELFTNSSCSNYSLNPNFVLNQVEGVDVSGPAAGARLVSGCLAHFAAVKTGALPPAMTRGGPLDMRQLPWVHSSARVANSMGPDVVECHLDKPKQHMVAMCRGQLYKVPLYEQGKGVASRELIEKQLAAIQTHASKLDASACRRTSVGALTCGERRPWETLRQKLVSQSPGDASVLRQVDEALLVLCLDQVGGLGAEGMERNVLYGVEGTLENRWMDKWNLIVTADGQSGMNWEHSLLDGHTMMEFLAPVADHHKSDKGQGVRTMCQGSDDVDEEAVGRAEKVAEASLALEGGDEASDEASDDASVQHLEWSWMKDPELSNINAEEEVAEAVVSAIEVALAEGLRLSESCGVETLEFKAYGGSFIKSSKCSPDGFAQAAMQIAFYDMTQKIPSCYESVLAKSFKHGRVTVARNMSDSIAANLRKFPGLLFGHPKAKQEECFRDIVAEIGRICREAASAQEVDRPLLAYQRLASDASLGPGLDMSSIVGTPEWGRFQDLDLCTSHCGKPPIRFFGYEPASANGFSVGYYVWNEGIQFSINHFDKNKAKDYKARLEKTLKALPSLLTK